MTLAILLLALIVATCFIAYFADNLGKHLGKKRISLKIGRINLRPRQTATLISMVSSVAIMLFTLGFLLVANKSIRNALLRYDAEKKAANDTRKENQQLVRDLGNQRTVLERQITKNQKLTKEAILQRKAAETGERAATERARKAQSRYTLEQSRFKIVQQQLRGAKGQYNDARRRLEGEKTRVEAARKGLETVRKSLGATRTQLDQAESNFKEAKARQQEASVRLQEAAARLNQTQSNLDKVKSQVDESREQFNTAKKDIDDLEILRTKLQSEVKELKSYTEIALQIATGDIAIHQGDVFSERTFLPGTSSRQAREALRELLKAGREKLQILHAPTRTLTLVQPTSVTPGENGSSLTEEEFLRGFAADLSTLNVPASVRLVAARDHASKETDIFAGLTLIIVRAVFPKGEILASADIDSSASDVQIFNQLQTLLSETEKRARARRVTPLITPDNPYFYAAGPYEVIIFEALRRIQSVGGKVRVDLVAAEDVTTVEPLKVRFEIIKE